VDTDKTPEFDRCENSTILRIRFREKAIELFFLLCYNENVIFWSWEAMHLKKSKVFYYESESCDFFTQNKPLPKIDENYKYKKGFFGRLYEFFLHRIVAPPIAFPYIKLFVREKYYGREKLKPYKKRAYFLYLNHTQPVADAVSPNVMIFPKKLRIIVNKENLALPGIGKATKFLGAIPLPDNLRAAKNFSDAVADALRHKNAIAVYPEAHVWPYYTGIRDFGAEALEPAVKNMVPVFTATRVYRATKKGRRPRQEIYIDGPFFPDDAVSKKEARLKLKSEIISAMRERASLSDCEFIKYVNVQDGAIEE